MKLTPTTSNSRLSGGSCDNVRLRSTPAGGSSTFEASSLIDTPRKTASLSSWGFRAILARRERSKMTRATCSCTSVMRIHHPYLKKTGLPDSRTVPRYVSYIPHPLSSVLMVVKTFHTDPFPDILGLHTRSCAARGGNHILSSAVSIYNTIAATRPDLLEVLAQPNWPFDRSVFHYFLRDT